MFSKKSLRITLAFVLLIGLASIGLAYGAWSQTLYINGHVTTGNYNVFFYNMGVWWQNDYSGVATCENLVSDDLHTMTIRVTNGYPGFECSGSSAIVNTGTVPVRVNGLVLVSGSSTSPYFTISLKDTNMVPASTGFDLPKNPTVNPPYTKYGAVDWSFSMPATETAGMNQTLDFAYTILTEQDVP